MAQPEADVPTTPTHPGQGIVGDCPVNETTALLSPHPRAQAAVIPPTTTTTCQEHAYVTSGSAVQAPDVTVIVRDDVTPARATVRGARELSQKRKKSLTSRRRDWASQSQSTGGVSVNTPPEPPVSSARRGPEHADSLDNPDIPIIIADNGGCEDATVPSVSVESEEGERLSPDLGQTGGGQGTGCGEGAGRHGSVSSIGSSRRPSLEPRASTSR